MILLCKLSFWIQLLVRRIIMIERCLKNLPWVFVCVALIGCASQTARTIDQTEIATPASSYTTAEQRMERTREIVSIDMSGYQKKIDNFIMILDPSASMSVPYGDLPKFELAMDTAVHLNRTIPDLDIKAGLRTFGHPVYTSLIHGITGYAKETFEDALMEIENTDGVSPMEFALDQTGKDLVSLGGSTGIIIISDGKNMDISPVLAARKLKKKYGDQVCIYTILVGNNPEGARILADIAHESRCGFTVNADDLISGQQMTDFVVKVFLMARKEEKKDQWADTDGDGVHDSMDDCQDTPKGARVTVRGCWEIGDVLFDFDKYDIKPVYYPILDDMADILKQNPGLMIKIDGHCDIMGTERYNDKLSINRANSGRAYLESKGVPVGQLNTEGFGFSVPKDTNQSSEGRAKNRRIEFIRVK